MILYSRETIGCDFFVEKRLLGLLLDTKATQRYKWMLEHVKGMMDGESSLREGENVDSDEAVSDVAQETRDDARGALDGSVDTVDEELEKADLMGYSEIYHTETDDRYFMSYPIPEHILAQEDAAIEAIRLTGVVTIDSLRENMLPAPSNTDAKRIIKSLENRRIVSPLQNGERKILGLENALPFEKTSNSKLIYQDGDFTPADKLSYVNDINHFLKQYVNTNEAGVLINIENEESYAQYSINDLIKVFKYLDDHAVDRSGFQLKNINDIFKEMLQNSQFSSRINPNISPQVMQQQLENIANNIQDLEASIQTMNKGPVKEGAKAQLRTLQAMKQAIDDQLS